MNTKAKWGAKPYKLQVYLPGNIKTALDKYVAEQFSPDSRVITAVVRKAVTEFLERAGYLEKQGGDG